jgi:hypothetical protein
VTDDDLIEELAGMLVRIEANYERETSGPGSRFEGQRLEVVQARAVLRRVLRAAALWVCYCGQVAPHGNDFPHWECQGGRPLGPGEVEAKPSARVMP